MKKEIVTQNNILLFATRLDSYIKKTCKNILIDKKRADTAKTKKQFSFVPFGENISNTSEYECFLTEIESEIIIVEEYSVMIADSELASSLKGLPKKQLLTLILFVVAETSISEIADRLKVSERMVKKYKKAAIDKIRMEMCNEKEDISGTL